MSPIRYLITFFILTGLWIGLVAAFNWAIDPYGLFNPPVLPELNVKKTKADGKIRFVKAWQLRDRRPNGLIIGSSRSEIGLRPDHACWPTGPTYNGALAGSNMYEVRRYYQHATAVAPVREVVLGLDLFMFNGHRGARTGFDEALLALDAQGRPNAEADPNGRWKSLFSLFTLVDSLGTALGQDRNRYYTRDGRLILWPPVVAGPRPLFRKTERMFHTIILFPGPARRFDLGEAPLAEYEWILRDAHAENRNLHLVISPLHARLSATLYLLGLEPTRESWLRRLVAINESVAAAAGRAPFPLWDFSGYNEVTTEAVPGGGEARMRFYRDPSHYTTTVGDRILDRVFGCGATTFGERVTSATVEVHLAKQRSGRETYMRDHPDDLAALRETARENADWRQ